MSHHPNKHHQFIAERLLLDGITDTLNESVIDYFTVEGIPFSVKNLCLVEQAMTDIQLDEDEGDKDDDRQEVTIILPNRLDQMVEPTSTHTLLPGADLGDFVNQLVATIEESPIMGASDRDSFNKREEMLLVLYNGRVYELLVSVYNPT